MYQLKFAAAKAVQNHNYFKVSRETAAVQQDSAGDNPSQKM